MEFKSFVAGLLFLTGVQLLLPFLGVKIAVSVPYAPVSLLVAGLLAILLSYYLFKTN